MVAGAPATEYERRGPAIAPEFPRRATDRVARAEANSRRSDRFCSSRRSWKSRSSFGALERRSNVAEGESDDAVPTGSPVGISEATMLCAVTVVPRLVAPFVDSL